MEVREGRVTISVPGLSTDGAGDAVFYNPNQERNRDVTVATLRAYRDREPDVETYLDATAASGIRGVRAAANGWTVTCCDRDPEAATLCETNLARNDLAGAVCARDTNALLHERAFDVVDLDPFGSPIPFADAAFAGARRLVCVTATDTAPLCGAHFRAGIRRYSAVPRRTEYHREMGLRILLSALCRTAARYDLAATPVLSHVEGHYVRTYLELSSGAGVADDVIDELGTLWHCEECLHRETERGVLGWRRERCPNCGGTNVVSAGPLWLGPAHDPAFVEAVAGRVDPETMATAKRARRDLETIAAELDTPTHYDQHVLCKRWGRTASPMDAFLDAIRSRGAEATRTHFGGTTFKTDASVAEIRAATAELSE